MLRNMPLQGPQARSGLICRARRAQAPLAASGSTPASGQRTILVLGGTGFVGRAFIKAARIEGHRVVSLSRRGQLPGEGVDPKVTWESGDATEPHVLQQVVDKHPAIDACFHCIGLLLDSDSGLANFNQWASGSGSIPAANATYDAVTRGTGLAAIDAMRGRSQEAPDKAPLPFVFVSAAEAGWDFVAPVPFLERYLIAKRAVEAALLQDEQQKRLLRGIVLRPSLIWTWEKPAALLSVLPFYIANAVGLPFVDKPVRVETLVAAALMAIVNENEAAGVKRFMDMERMEKWNP